MKDWQLIQWREVVQLETWAAWLSGVPMVWIKA